mgnify:CR=1 FL=1
MCIRDSPATVTAVNDFRILMNMYDGLVRYKDGTLEVEPALAKSWTISDDGKTYTFSLRSGISFHDGSKFDANAVKFNFDRMLDKNHPYHNTGPFPLSFFFSAIENVEVVSDNSVRFTLNAPYAPFLSNLAYPTGLIASPEAIKNNGSDFGRNPVGTGAFKFKSWKDFIETLAHEMVHLYQMQIAKDPYSNHNNNFYKFRDKFKQYGLALFR